MNLLRSSYLALVLAFGSLVFAEATESNQGLNKEETSVKVEDSQDAFEDIVEAPS